MPFAVRVAEVDEYDVGDPTEAALANARRKARAVAGRLQRSGREDAGGQAGQARRRGADAQSAGADAQSASADDRALSELPILASDTVVALDGQVLGAPARPDEAARFLRALSGRRHEVVSAVCLLVPGACERTAVSGAQVQFRALDEATVAWYVASREWQGRAGGYAIQLRGMALVERLEGDPTAVVGLPVPALLELWPGLLHGEPPPPA